MREWRASLSAAEAALLLGAGAKPYDLFHMREGGSFLFSQRKNRVLLIKTTPAGIGRNQFPFRGTLEETETGCRLRGGFKPVLFNYLLLLLAWLIVLFAAILAYQSGTGFWLVAAIALGFALVSLGLFFGFSAMFYSAERDAVLQRIQSVFQPKSA